MFPVIWEIILTEKVSYFGRSSPHSFLWLNIFVINEETNYSVVELLAKNQYGNWSESKAKIEISQALRISDFADKFSAKKDDFNVKGVFDTCDSMIELSITIRNGLGEFNKPLTFYISMQCSGFEGRDAPLAKDFLRYLFELTNQEIPHYLIF